MLLLLCAGISVFACVKQAVWTVPDRTDQVCGLQGRLAAEWLNETDCVGAWQSEQLAAVLFPTADSLGELRNIQLDGLDRRLMLVINPQWSTSGQIVSDFGCVPDFINAVPGFLKPSCPVEQPMTAQPGRSVTGSHP